MSTCNSCYKPVTVCCCPTPAPAPAPVPTATCLNPIVVLLDEANDCFKDQPCQNQNCQSPITAWMTNVIQNFDGNPVTEPEVFNEYFTAIIDGGVVLANQSYCCSQCCEDGAYFLGGASTKAADGYFDAGGTVSCCANFYGTLESQTELMALYTDYNLTPPTKCDNNFNQCVQYLADNTANMNALIALGILETVGSLGQSEICNLVSVMLSASFTPDMIQTTFQRILNTGLVASCQKGQIYVGGIDGFGTWISMYRPIG